MKKSPQPNRNLKSHLPFFIKVAYKEASTGSKKGHGGPFGAVVIRNNKIIASGHNTVIIDNDPTCHAEVNAMRAACKKLRRPHLKDCILIASSEPCPMCLTTAYWAQIHTIYYTLPRSVAAGVGFNDDFIYVDLAKKPAKRDIAVILLKGFLKEGKTIFSAWQKKAANFTEKLF